MRYQTDGLTGMVMGSGRVNLLLGWIWLNGSDLAPLRGARPQISWAAAPDDWATQAARARRPVGPCHRFGPKAEFK
jgi:hypothetical protein